MVDDLNDRLARYRVDLDAAVLADLSRRRPGQPDSGLASGGAGFGGTSGGAASPTSDNADSPTLDLDPADGTYDLLPFELTPAEESPRSRHRGLGAWIVVVAASAAAIAVTTAVLIAHDDTTAPASVPASAVSVGGQPATSGATTDSPTTTTSTNTTMLPLVTVDELLPPASAVPSSPEAGELVAGVAKIHDGAWFLYADGRLISIDDHRDGRGGWSEQRLTSEGVERVRAEFLASGLFDQSQQPNAAASAGEDTPSYLRVRDGGRLLTARDSGNPVDGSLSTCVIDTPGTKCSLVPYMRELASSLPQNGWVDQQLTRYVPAEYTVCFTRVDGISNGPLADLPAVLAMMPSPAPELLGGRAPTRDFFEARNSCFDLTIAETRLLTAAFIDAYRLRWHMPWEGVTYGFGTGTQVQLASRTVDVTIDIWPLLPAGGVALWGG